MKYESNIFAIQNLEALSSNYVPFEILGLNRKDDDDDYEINIQHIIRSLSYKLKHPATIIHRDQTPLLIIRQEDDILKKLPKEYTVKKGNVVYFKPAGDALHLDFKQYTPETKSVILRFLQFDIQTELNKVATLWQPSSGNAFFSRNSNNGNAEVAIYYGFLARVTEVPGGGFGICVDVTQKYIARTPLKYDLTRREFKVMGVAKSNYIYHYGNRQYEIKPKQFSDLSVRDFKFTRQSDNRTVSLLDDIRSQYGTSMPPMVAKLPDTASVLIYTTNDNEERHVAAGLCFKVYDTEDPAVRQLHRGSILPPFERRRYVRIVFEKYIKHIKFGEIPLLFDSKPVQLTKKKFQVPDTLFGNGEILSPRQFQKGNQFDIKSLAKKRKENLFQKGIGGFTVATFERQLFVVPETVYNMYGSNKYFLSHLTHYVNLSHPSETGWNPDVITYDNRNKTSAVEIGFEILEKIEQHMKGQSGGYAVVMLPAAVEKSKRRHDDLAALVVSQCLDEHKISASIMHSQVLEECFYHQSENGQPVYKIKDQLRGKYQSYLQGVTLNQVLLNNERWPFILNQPLHGDIIVGIDVKRNVAGFTFVDKNCKHILTKFDRSDRKEKLSEAQMATMLAKHIALMAGHADYPIQNIVIHRDGRLFNTEKAGIRRAIKTLIDKGKIPATAQVTMVEIPKHSIVPFRLFEPLQEYDVLKTEYDNGKIQNPEVGSWHELSSKEAILCTTGKEFSHRRGTSNPLYIKVNEGAIPLEQVVEDIYFLSCLPYTRPEDCSRFPLTIKITDRRINNLGSDYDSEALEILKSENIKL